MQEAFEDLQVAAQAKQAIGTKTNTKTKTKTKTKPIAKTKYKIAKTRAQRKLSSKT